MGKKQKKKHLHKDLKGFEIRVNTFGELESSLDIDQLNAFLDRNTDDKKLREREDLHQEEE